MFWLNPIFSGEPWREPKEESPFLLRWSHHAWSDKVGKFPRYTIYFYKVNTEYKQIFISCVLSSSIVIPSNCVRANSHLFQSSVAVITFYVFYFITRQLILVNVRKFTYSPFRFFSNNNNNKGHKDSKLRQRHNNGVYPHPPLPRRSNLKDGELENSI